MSERVFDFLEPAAPFDGDWVFSFLERRAIPGVEAVNGHCYRRRLAEPGHDGGWLEVRGGKGGLEVSMPATVAERRRGYLDRVSQIFDLNADAAGISAALGDHPRLAATVALRPGIRVPGAWDPFELAVRAVLGQQVSVARATDLGVRLVARYGEALAGGGVAFPTAERLAESTPAEIGMPGRRGEAIAILARAHSDGALKFDAPGDELRASLVAIPGIGPWTAEYIAMRAGRDPDAFVASDWVILKRLGTTPAGAQRLAEAWRPWRAYAVMYLWAES
jgi:3-methyladenine DNA glycosylase/8-oxoguanine DNA glycosylase